MSDIYSPDFLIEQEPYFRVEVNGVTLPVILARQISLLEVTEEEGKKTSFELDIRDPKQVTGERYFHLQDQVTLFIGYRTRYEKRGPFEVVDLERKITSRRLLVIGVEGGRLDSKTNRRVITHGTIGEVFESIAQKSGLDLIHEGIDEFYTVISSDKPLVQTGETDGRFLQKVANDFGWLVSVINGSLHVTAAAARKSLGVIELRFDSAVAEIATMDLKHRKPRVSHEPVPDLSGKSSSPEDTLGLPERDFVALRKEIQDEWDEKRAVLDRRLEQKLFLAEVNSEDFFRAYDEFDADLVKIDQHRQALLDRLSEKEKRLEQHKTAIALTEAGKKVQEGVKETEKGIDEAGKTGANIELPAVSGTATLFQPGLTSLAAGSAAEEEFAQDWNDETVEKEWVHLVDGKVVRSTEGAVHNVKRYIGRKYNPSGSLGTAHEEKDSPKKLKGRKVLKEANAKEASIKLKLGSTRFRVQTEISVTGTNNEEADGPWRVGKVTQRFNSSDGFVTNMEFKRGHNKKEKKPPKDDPPTGGEELQEATGPEPDDPPKKVEMVYLVDGKERRVFE
jgi:phage protein D